METISIRVKSGVAKVLQSAGPEQQEKIQALISVWLEKAINSTQFLMTMDKMSDEAASNGLTPGILQSIQS